MRQGTTTARSLIVGKRRTFARSDDALDYANRHRQDGFSITVEYDEHRRLYVVTASRQ